MDPQLTVAEIVATHARTRPHRVGAKDSKRELTFAAWNERATRLANAWLERGLAPGDRIAVLAYNCVEWMEIYVATARAGLVVVPVNFRLTPPEIEYIATHADVQAFLVQGALRENADAVRGKLSLPDERWILFHPEDDAADYLVYEDLIEAASPTPPDVTVEPDDTFAFMYTSGTTGRPKGAIRSHRGNALIAQATAFELGFEPNDAALLVMPMCHANSLYFAMTFVYLGGTVVVEDARSFDPERLLAKLSTERIAFTSLVPTHYILMLALPDDVKAKYDVSSVRKLMVSSSPARRDTKIGILEFFSNSSLFELYGSTEAGWVTIVHPHEQLDHLGSVGREWAFSGRIKLLDKDGNEVPDGEAGELFSRTGYAFKGYWNNPEKTAEAFHGAWCSVGDIARRDEDGYVWLVDRKSNMIISGGENVYPSEVEGAVGAHPKVRDVAVIGLPDPKWGETVVAVVVLHEGEDAAPDELTDWCRDRLAGYKLPRRVIFLTEDEMPRTATGKILHRNLRERFSEA